ncbi:MAG: GGDEF domain-containing protein [Spirochaetota bacterium]
MRFRVVERGYTLPAFILSLLLFAGGCVLLVFYVLADHHSLVSISPAISPVTVFPDHSSVVSVCVIALSILLMVPLLAVPLHAYVSYSKKLEGLAVTDELTGTMNRRAVLHYLDVMMELSERHNSCLSVCFVDIDRLKLINDAEGHVAGDRYLCDFCDIVRGSIRKTDAVGRLGGDEFLIVFPFTRRIDAEGIICEIRDKCNNAGSADRCIYFSSGCAESPPYKEISASDLIHAADRRMYADKEKRHH